MKTNQNYNDIRNLYRALFAGRKDSDYVADSAQLKKVQDLAGFFKAENDCDVTVDLKPSYIAGGVTVTAVLFDFYGERLNQLRELLSYASAVSLDVQLPDKVCISISIPDVFKTKQESKE